MAKINPFAELNAEDMSRLIEKYDCETDPKQLAAIKEKTFKKVGLEKKKKFSSSTFRRIAAAAACICMVILAAVMALTLSKDKPPTTSSPTSLQTTLQGTQSNPLITAISKGDDRLIGSLLENSVFVSEDVLNYAMKFMNLLSYRSIRDIAKAVQEKFGSTGLDPLVENAVLGNSDEVVSLLSKRESLGTLNDRIAYFFSAAFCSSDTLRLFHEKGMDVGTTDENGDTVYEIAEKYGNEENKNYARNMGVNN